MEISSDTTLYCNCPENTAVHYAAKSFCNDLKKIPDSEIRPAIEQYDNQIRLFIDPCGREEGFSIIKRKKANPGIKCLIRFLI